LTAVAPDWGGVVDLDGESGESSGPISDEHESRVKAASSRAGGRKFGTRISERTLSNRMILRSELESHSIPNLSSNIRRAIRKCTIVSDNDKVIGRSRGSRCH